MFVRFPKRRCHPATGHAPERRFTAKVEQERTEDERKEQHLKQAIEGICRGC